MANKSYLYIDKYGILHAAKDEESAKQYSKNGKYSKEEIPADKGYPLVNSEDGLVDITVYGLNKRAYINGNETDGKEVCLDNYPSIKTIYKKLM